MVKTSETPAALRVITCKAKVRHGGKVEPCGKKYLAANKVCPERDEHLHRLKTGFCYNGWHEGDNPTDWKGKPVPTCEFFVTCPCDCHTKLGKLFEMTGQERILVESSAYRPPERDFWLPSDDPLDVPSRDDGVTVPVILESPAPDRVPATVARDFGPTPTGRAARGELEAWVKQHCDIWLIDEPGNHCTPSYLATEIAHDQGIIPPSVGAITAVFNRWADLEFAVIEKKPTRFVRYTPDGIKLGLDRMKANARMAKRRQLADDRRNLRR